MVATTRNTPRKKEGKIVILREVATTLMNHKRCHAALLKSHGNLDGDFKVRVPKILEKKKKESERDGDDEDSAEDEDDKASKEEKADEEPQGEVWEKDDIHPKNLEALRVMVEKHWGKKHPSLNNKEKS